MALSVGNFHQFLHQKEVVLDLEGGKLRVGENEETKLDLNDWPLLLFLNTQGFSRVTLRNPSQILLDAWTQRIADLEQVYIHDPESLNHEAVLWDALDENAQTLIHCEKVLQQKPERLFTHNSTIPPFAAPLHLAPEVVSRFLSELRLEKDLDILRRYIVILNEFLRVEAPHHVAEKLLLRALEISMQNAVPELALDLVKSHSELWEKVLQREGMLDTVLSFYDPKPQDIPLWSQLFQSVPSDKVLERCIALRGNPLENRALKLIHYRSLRFPAEFLDLAFHGDLHSQRLVVPTLYTAWTPSHYEAILQKVLKAVECDEMVDEWIQALLHVDENRGLEDISRHFFVGGFFSKKSKGEHQIAVMKAILRHQPKALKNFMPRFLKAMKQTTKTKIEFQLNLWDKKVSRS